MEQDDDGGQIANRFLLGNGGNTHFFIGKSFRDTRQDSMAVGSLEPYIITALDLIYIPDL